MFLMVAMLVVLPGLPEPAQPSGPPSLQNVKAEETNGRIILTFSTTEAAVPGAVKALDAPSRLYFDIPGFRPGKTRNWKVERGAVGQVRAALNQPNPAVTRVVIDLTGPVSWKVEPGRSPREFKVVVSAKPEVPVAPVVPEIPGERRAQIAAGLAVLAPTLEAMRAGDGPTDGALMVLLSRAETLAAAARALRGPGGGGDALLQVAADAVLTAARARAAALASGDAQSRANAASAAAGALLLIDQIAR